MLVCILCPLSNLPIGASPRAASQPAPPLCLEMNRPEEEWETMSDLELWISPTAQRSRGTVAEVGVFPPTARDRPGVKVADWQGGKVAGGLH